jgi:lipooligosaccharide transport system permease protein
MMATQITHRSLAVWLRNRDVFLHIWKSELIWPIFEPVIVLMGLGLGLGSLVTLKGDQEYIAFIATGLMAAFPMWAAIAEAGWVAYNRMANQHVYDAMMATPVSLTDVVTGEVLWGATKSTINGAYIVAIALVLTPWYDIVRSPLVVLVLPVGFLAGLMFASMALLATSRVRTLGEMAYFVSLVIMPMFWVGGVFFPLEQLPDALQKAAWLMPMTHVVQIERALNNGTPHWSNLADLAWIVVATGIFFNLMLWSMKRRLVK